MSKINVGIVASEFNYDLTMAMVGLAKEEATFLEVEVSQVVTVPGVFDMPLAVKKMLDKKKVDGVVTLGSVIEGQTEHDELVAQHAARKILDLSIETGKPVTLGITGPGMSRIEAHTRVRNAKTAMESCVKMVKRLKEMG
ncbi:6,7-dimethyl-8-ribityllumazine synthase [Candidatus Altiarchaeota archaeon]